MTNDAVTAFQQRLRGRLIQPGDADYDSARALYNGMIDKRPRMIARAANVADVITGVNFAREQGLLLAIRGGGHNGPGLGSCNDGLVIDLSTMNGVRVDPSNRTVRVEPGCTSGDVDHATHAFGLAVPFGIVSTTGVAGLTLGGGTGYLTRKHGLTIDNLLEVDLVLADGRFVTASAREHPDLFWAIRGGGGNFGVITSFLFQAHPVSDGLCRADFLGRRQGRPGRHARVSRFSANGARRARRVRRPEDGALYRAVPQGTLGQARLRRDLQFQRSTGRRRASDGAPVVEAAAPALQLDGRHAVSCDAGTLRPFFPKGLQWYWKGDFVKSLSDDAIDTHIKQAASAPSELCLMHLYPIDGAVHRVRRDGTAWSARDATWSMVIAGIDNRPTRPTR